MTGFYKLKFDTKPRAVLLDAGFPLVFCAGERIAVEAAARGVHVDAAALEASEPTLRRELARYSWASTPAAGQGKHQAAGPAFFRRLLDLAAADGTAAEL